MPLDASKFVGLDDRIRIVPPIPPERGEEPRRLHIVIEIVVRRAPPPPPASRPRQGVLRILVRLLFVALIVAGLAAMVGHDQHPRRPVPTLTR